MIFVDKNGIIHIVNRCDFLNDNEYFSKIYYIKTNNVINNNDQKKKIISTILYEDN